MIKRIFTFLNVDVTGDLWIVKKTNKIKIQNRLNFYTIEYRIFTLDTNDQTQINHFGHFR